MKSKKGRNELITREQWEDIKAKDPALAEFLIAVKESGLTLAAFYYNEDPPPGAHEKRVRRLPGRFTGPVREPVRKPARAKTIESSIAKMRETLNGNNK